MREKQKVDPKADTWEAGGAGTKGKLYLTKAEHQNIKTRETKVESPGLNEKRQRLKQSTTKSKVQIRTQEQEFKIQKKKHTTGEQETQEETQDSSGETSHKQQTDKQHSENRDYIHRDYIHRH